MNLTKNQRDILKHVIVNGTNRQNEGDFAETQGLEMMGLMEDRGKFFAVTKAGLEAFEATYDS